MKKFISSLIRKIGWKLADGILQRYDQYKRENSTAIHTSSFKKQAESENSSNELRLTKAQSGRYWVTHTSDSVIGRAIRDKGSFLEQDITDCMQILEKLNCKKEGRIFLDIGSNIGTHAIYALLNDFQFAYCVEPDSLNFSLLRINQILNGVDDRCFNSLMAISDFDGEADLEISPVNFGDHRIRVNDLGIDKKSVHGEDRWDTRKTTVKRLDVFCKENEIDITNIGLIWIDTQGHEGHVLQGGAEIIKAEVPIVIEFWPYGLERSGGYGKLRDKLNHVNKIIDLQASKEEKVPVAMTIKELDLMYEELNQKTEKNHTPYTDLLLI